MRKKNASVSYNWYKSLASARSQSAFGGQEQYYIMPATSATKFSSKRKAMAASPQPQSSLSSTKSGIFETIVFTKKILQTTKSGGGPANKRQQSCTSLCSAVGFFFLFLTFAFQTKLLMESSNHSVLDSANKDLRLF